MVAGLIVMTRILMTNDDGIHSDGLIKLEEALKELGDVYVVAPAAEMSGASHSLTLARPLRIRQLDARHWAVDGTPTDCVTLALNKILPDEEHLTSAFRESITAAISATTRLILALSQALLRRQFLGVPGMALSLVARDNFDFTDAAAFASRCGAKSAWKKGLPEGTLLNINLPPGEIKGVRVTRQGIKECSPRDN